MTLEALDLRAYSPEELDELATLGDGLPIGEQAETLLAEQESAREAERQAVIVEATALAQDIATAILEVRADAAECWEVIEQRARSENRAHRIICDHALAALVEGKHLPALVEKMHEHAALKNYDVKQLGEKRAIGAFMGLVVVLESTEIGLREPTETHPAWTARVQGILPAIEALELDHNGHFWVFATSVMLSRLRRDDINVGVLSYSSARDLFFQVFERFEHAAT